MFNFHVDIAAMSENNGRMKRLDTDWDEGKDERRRFKATGRADSRRPTIDRSKMLCSEPKSGVDKHRNKMNGEN